MACMVRQRWMQVLYRPLLARAPHNLTWCFHLGDVYRMIGDNHYFLGEVNAALA